MTYQSFHLNRRMKTLSLFSFLLVASGLYGCATKKPQLRRIDERPQSAAAASIDDATQEDATAEEPAQTYDEAWKMICGSAILSNLDTSMGRDAQGDALAAWLTANLSNKKARYWLIGLSKVEEEKKYETFHAEAMGPGKQPTCAVVAVLFPQASSRAVSSQPAAATPPASAAPSTVPAEATPAPAAPVAPTPESPVDGYGVKPSAADAQK